MTTPGFGPSYNGTYNADDPLVAPWWIPGWTSQNVQAKTELATPGSSLGSNFPSNLAFVNVTATYVDPNSSGTGGYLTFQMSDSIVVNDGGKYYRLPQRLTGYMNQATGFAYNNWGNGKIYLRFGGLSVQLFATDQTASGSTITTDSGNGFFYFVTEHFLGGRTYHIQVPSSDAGTSVDINTLIVPGTVGEYKYDPVYPMGDLWAPDEEPGTTGKYTGV
jgi:hypothetical protein